MELRPLTFLWFCVAVGVAVGVVSGFDGCRIRYGRKGCYDKVHTGTAGVCVCVCVCVCVRKGCYDKVHTGTLCVRVCVCVCVCV